MRDASLCPARTNAAPGQGAPGLWAIDGDSRGAHPWCRSRGALVVPARGLERAARATPRPCVRPFPRHPCGATAAPVRRSERGEDRARIKFAA